MTIESEVSRMATALETIASVFEDWRGITQWRNVTPNPTGGEVGGADNIAGAVGPQKRKRRTAAEIAADSAVGSVPLEVSKPTETTEKLTITDVRAALVALQTAKGAAASVKILSDYGASTLSKIPEDKYAEVIAKAKKAM